MPDLNLEVGKTYLTRSGRTLKIIRKSILDQQLFMSDHFGVYHSNGTIHQGVVPKDRWDLVSEVTGLTEISHDSNGMYFVREIDKNRHDVYQKSSGVVVVSAAGLERAEQAAAALNACAIVPRMIALDGKVLVKPMTHEEAEIEWVKCRSCNGTEVNAFKAFLNRNGLLVE